MLSVAIAFAASRFVILSAQEATLQSKIEHRVQELASDNPEVRESATRALRSLGPAAIGPLEETLKGIEDVDLTLRVRAVIKDLWMQKSETLFAGAQLEDALLSLATAESPSDPAGYRDRRIKEAKSALEALVKIGEGSLIKTIGPRHSAVELRTKYGRWMLPVLIERFHPEAPVDHSEDLELLKQWGEDALPALLGALKSKDERFVSVLCDALHSLGRGAPQVLKAFRELSEDQSRSERIRKLALALFLDLGGKIEK